MNTIVKLISEGLWAYKTDDSEPYSASGIVVAKNEEEAIQKIEEIYIGDLENLSVRKIGVSDFIGLDAIEHPEALELFEGIC